MKSLPFLFTLLTLCIVFQGHSQSSRLFSGDLDLSNSLIHNVLQDRKGNIWIATEDGLNRFDGSKFTIYKHDRLDPRSLLNNYVRLVFEDDHGRVLIGLFNGLQWYDHATESFEQIPLVIRTGEKLDAHVMTATQLKNGDILLGTAGFGTFSLRFDSGKPAARQINDKIPGAVVERLYEDSTGTLWVATQDKGLLTVSPDGVIKYYGAGDGPKSPISGICEDHNGTLYFGSASNGLFTYDHQAGAFSAVPYAPVAHLPIEAIAPSKNNEEIYIGTDGYGMKIYNIEKKIIEDARLDVTTFKFDHAKVHAVLEDRSGNLWLGIFQKGVMLLPAHTSNFIYVGYKSVKNNTIGSNAVLSILEDHEGTRWVGTDSDGLYAITRTGERKAHYEHTADPTSVPATIMCLFEDSEKNLWVGSYLRGLAKFNRKTGRCDYVKTLAGPNGKRAKSIFSMAEDEHKNLWIATMGTGLFSLNLKTGAVKHFEARYSIDKAGQNSLHNDWITCLLRTNDNKIYIGSYDGLGCLDVKTQHFASTFGTHKLLAGHIIYTLFQDRNGTLWIGTSQGLMYLDKATGGIVAYTVEDGLPSNVICAIRGDQDNNLWISTNYGISKFNPTTKSFLNFYASDGLQGNEFSKFAAFTNTPGELFFGGINGLTIFNPADISQATPAHHKPEVRITGFYIHDKSVKKGTTSGEKDIIDRAVMDAAEFRLAYNDNSFGIELSTQELANQERTIYHYSVDNEPWTKLRAGTNMITFNDLGAGTYPIRITASNYNKASDVKEITVIIAPIWYLSPVAKMTYLLIGVVATIMLMLYLRNRQMTREKLRTQEQAKKINEAKVQFFLNISHEIRTPLSLIISPLKKLLLSDKDTERRKSYGTMQRNSERILHLINQLMDISKIEKGQLALKFQEVDIVEYVKGICSIFDDQSDARKITFTLNAEPHRIPAWIDPRQFDKAIINVLSNAFKFTPDHGVIDVSIRAGRETAGSGSTLTYQIIIADNGIGIPDNEKHKIFECFHQVKNAHNHFVEGTGIGLNLTRSIIDLHHGQIRVENNSASTGSCFIMSMPLGKDHLRQDELDIPMLQEAQHDPISTTRSTANTADAGLKPRSKSRHHILLVDDDPEIRKYIRQELESEYHVRESANGKEGLAAALAKAPDLIISDVKMPDMDGITFCRKVKQNININHVPVILLTAKANDEDNLEGLGIGADAYMVKPFNVEILKKTMEAIIRNREMLRNSFSGNQMQDDKVRKVEFKSADEKLLTKIVDIINANIANTDFNVEMMSAEIGISRVHLHRKMKELTSQSTRDFIRNTRLKQAAQLLSGKHQNVSDVAYATGFATLAVFSTAFKDLYGVSPREYMLSHDEQHPQDIDR